MEQRWTPYHRIARPLEAHGVATADAYRAWQRSVIVQNREKRPSLKWRDPFVADTEGVTPFVSGGRWVVLCQACRNCPVYDPDWQLACCGECGAIYVDVMPPVQYVLAEMVLMGRAEMTTRNWVPSDETIADLISENIEHGDDVGVSDDIAAPVRQQRATQATLVVETVVEAALPLRSVVFVGDDTDPHILHDDAVVSVEQDREMFPHSEEIADEAAALASAERVATALATVTKGGTL